MKAFKKDHYRTTTLHADGTQEISQSYRDTLSSLLITKLGKLDKKYHVYLPLMIDDWTRSHEYLEHGTLDEGDASVPAGVNNDLQEEQGKASTHETVEKAKAAFEEQELEYLKKAWQSWLQSARDKDGERVVSAAEGRSRLKSTIREKLSSLETAE